MAALDQFIESINSIDLTHEYWFVRTDSGEYFDSYVQNNFIGIGWNYVTMEDLVRRTPEDMKARIAKKQKLDLEDPKAKGKVTAIYNKLIRFKDLRKGDRIMIPSQGSRVYAFGVVQDDRVFVDTNQSFGCPYYKRRSIKWTLQEEMRNLDANFYKIRMSRHAISSIKEHAGTIDKVMDNVFIKSGRSHFILNVDRQENINLKALTTLVNGLEGIMQKINIQLSLGEDISQSVIKLNLQSKGLIELIEDGRALIILAALISSLTLTGDASLALTPSERVEFENLKTICLPELTAVDSAMVQLEINREKINSGLAGGTN